MQSVNKLPADIYILIIFIIYEYLSDNFDNHDHTVCGSKCKQIELREILILKLLEWEF